MRGYQITVRGWALIVVLLCLLALLVLGGFKLISTLAAEGEPSPSADEPSPTGDFRVTPSGAPSPSVSSDVTPTGVPTPPPPTAAPTPSPTPIVVITQPPAAPVYTPVPSRPTPASTPQPTQTPTPPPDSPPEPTPDPTPEPPDWAQKVLSVLFLWNSEEMAEPELVLEDIIELLPPDGDLAEYIILIEGYASDDETKDNLALLRAETLETLILEELELDPSVIRVEAVTDPETFDRKLQRADISFRYVGNK